MGVFPADGTACGRGLYVIVVVVAVVVVIGGRVWEQSHMLAVSFNIIGSDELAMNIFELELLFNCLNYRFPV